MKLNIKITTACLLLTTLFSCTEVLDQLPDDRIDIDKYYVTRDDAETALIGVYDQVFGTCVPAIMLLNSLSAREMEQKSDIRLRAVQYRPNLRIDNDGGAGSLWRNSYNAIARINLLLERAPAISTGAFDEIGMPAGRDRKNELLAEARALRAYLYYHMVQYWGDIPLVTTFAKSANASDNLVARTPAAQVWTLIDEDLTFAEQYLPWNHNFLRIAGFSAAQQRTNTKGRFTKGMAKLMLARIALKDQNWTVAAAKAKEIMDNGAFTLNPLFQLTFLNTPAGTSQNAPESILETQVANATSPSFNNTGGIGTWEFVAGNTVQITDTLFNMYEHGPFNLPDNRALTDPRDVRIMFSQNLRDPNIYNADRSIRGICMFKYYNRDNTYASTDAFNYVLGRLGEVHLIRAEALNELSGPTAEAIGLINGLRNRARDLTYSAVLRRPGTRPDTTVFPKGIRPVVLNAATTATTLGVTDKASFRRLIREERWRELAFEGHQWFDILRYDAQDKTKNALKVVYLDNPSLPGTNEGKLLLPIPDAERVINPRLTQNPGY
jgi:starch-binding outer membrane protein, SusD/RagB family